MDPRSSNDDCINSVNPYHCLLERPSELDKYPISNHFLSFSLGKVLTPLNRYLMSSLHPNGICLKNGDENLNNASQTECVNAISELAVSGPPIVDVNEDHFIKCKLYDSCKNIYENYVWWDEMNNIIAGREAVAAEEAAAEQQRQQRVNVVQQEATVEVYQESREPGTIAMFGRY